MNSESILIGYVKQHSEREIPMPSTKTIVVTAIIALAAVYVFNNYAPVTLKAKLNGAA